MHFVLAGTDSITFMPFTTIHTYIEEPFLTCTSALVPESAPTTFCRFLPSVTSGQLLALLNWRVFLCQQATPCTTFINNRPLAPQRRKLFHQPLPVCYSVLKEKQPFKELHDYGFQDFVKIHPYSRESKRA
uniref:Uncharacterized protein n=1 Tax=Arundo donax TaxID=35708 RepID=A0A0A9HY75_ARUDO